MDLIERLRQLGFSSIDNSRLGTLPGPLFTQVFDHTLPNADYGEEWNFLKKLLVPEATIIPHLSKTLLKHDRPARREPVSVGEFWHCFGKWLVDQVFYSERGRDMTKNEIEDAKIAVKFGLSEDRQKTIVAAFNLGDDELGAAFLDHRTRLSNLIMVGNLLAIDETILASNSRQAK